MIRTVVHHLEARVVVHAPDHGGEQLVWLGSVEAQHLLAHGHGAAQLVAHPQTRHRHLRHHHAALPQQGHVPGQQVTPNITSPHIQFQAFICIRVSPVVDSAVAALVLTAEVRDGLVGHEGCEHLAVAGQLVHQRGVQVHVLPTSAHRAAEIYQSLAGHLEH